jgi:hypothetical protein
VEPASEPVIDGWSTPTGRRRSPWVRTGLVAAILWVGLGLAVAFLSARAGAPTASGWLALLTGPVVLFIVGQRARVRGRGDWALAGLLEFGVVLVLGTTAIFSLTLSGAFGAMGGSSSIESVGFGTGGTDCAITGTASTFTPADPVRAVAEFSPELPTGTVVKIWLSLDGTVLESSRASLTLDAPAGCVSGALSDVPLATGHYRWDISPDTAPPISGEFDVTR